MTPTPRLDALMPGMPLRPDRVVRYVTAFCPACHAESPDRPLHQVERLAGYRAVADGRVWLVRGCPTHGRVVTLYDEEPEILAYLEQWTAPTKAHVPDRAGNWAPVPAAYLRGLGEMQTQHTCILLEDVTATCNLCCPTCFAESAPGLGGVVPVEEVLANVDQRLARENGRLDVLMLSGGEPTTHPHFAELLDRVLERDVVRVLVNSNGLALARDDGLLRVFERHRERVEVYLQFDGFRRETHRHHRGAALGRVKADAVRRLSEAGVFTTLTMTAAFGVNDDASARGAPARSTRSRGSRTAGCSRGSGRRPTGWSRGATSRRCRARTRTAARSATCSRPTAASGSRSSGSSGTSGCARTSGSSPTGSTTRNSARSCAGS